MSTSHVRAHTQLPCQVFVAALTDFSDRREQVFGNSTGSYLKVHGAGETWAEVTEGSDAAGGVWQRLRYDWSVPGRVRLDVLDGNAFGRGGWWDYRMTPDGQGCQISLTISRAPVTTKARFLDIFLLGYGRVFHGRDLRRTLRRLEAA